MLCLSIPSGALPHKTDVQIEGSSGTDSEGSPIPAWTNSYTGLTCFVDALKSYEADLWKRRGIDVDFNVFYGSMKNGSLPTINPGNRIVFGKRADGKPRTFEIRGRANEGELGVMLTVVAKELP